MKIVFTTLIFSFLSMDVMAQENPCASEIEKFCKKEYDSKGDFVSCLQKNLSKASASCKAHHKKMSDMLSVIKPMCHEDYQKHCTTAGATKEEISSCMNSKMKEFSSECKKQMGEAK